MGRIGSRVFGEYRTGGGGGGVIASPLSSKHHLPPPVVLRWGDFSPVLIIPGVVMGDGSEIQMPPGLTGSNASFVCHSKT